MAVNCRLRLFLLTQMCDNANAKTAIQKKKMKAIEKLNGQLDPSLLEKYHAMYIVFQCSIDS